MSGAGACPLRSVYLSRSASPFSGVLCPVRRADRSDALCQENRRAESDCHVSTEFRQHQRGRPFTGSKRSVPGHPVAYLPVALRIVAVSPALRGVFQHVSVCKIDMHIADAAVRGSQGRTEFLLRPVGQIFGVVHTPPARPARASLPHASCPARRINHNIEWTQRGQLTSCHARRFRAPT